MLSAVATGHPAFLQTLRGARKSCDYGGRLAAEAEG